MSLESTPRAALLAVLLAAAGAAGCSQPQATLPPSAPPAPPPPRAEAPPPPAREQSVLPPEPAVPPPSYLVAVVVREGDARKPAPDESRQLAAILTHNGLTARVAPVTTDLPDNIFDAAVQAARGPHVGRTGDVFLYGEVTPGAKHQVRLVAVDMKKGQYIENAGAQGPGAKMEGMLRTALSELLPTVESYWRMAVRQGG